jgi:hypothetical protein
MFSAILAAISAIVAGGISIWGATQQNEATAAAGKEAKGLALLNRQDELTQANTTNQLNLKSLAQRAAESRQANKQFGQSLSEQKRQFNEQQAMATIKSLQDRADKSPEYRKELVSLWGV